MQEPRCEPRRSCVFLCSWERGPSPMRFPGGSQGESPRNRCGAKAPGGRRLRRREYVRQPTPGGYTAVYRHSDPGHSHSFASKCMTYRCGNSMITVFPLPAEMRFPVVHRDFESISNTSCHGSLCRRKLRATSISAKGSAFKNCPRSSSR
jgi:hypothetical protein